MLSLGNHGELDACMKLILLKVRQIQVIYLSKENAQDKQGEFF